MYFNSLIYFLFLPAVWLLFVLAGEKRQWVVLLLASLAFYAALRIPYLLVVLLFVTLWSYLAGLLIASSRSEGRKKRLLVVALAFLLAPMLLFRHLPLIAAWLLHALHPDAVPPPATAPPVLAAVGVSYYAFQAISYLIDLYLDKIPAERHAGYFFLYMAFFPKLLQGPIERAGELLPQIKARYRFDYDQLRAGLLLFAWGLFKKGVAANRLEGYVNLVYGDPHGYSGWALLLATWGYALQLYCDFSGYTDMALGSARLFGINLTDNFRIPYAAASVMEFWRRWHISFSRCLLDYLFKPIQMALRGWRNAGSAVALIVTFLLSGLWHGLSWCFLIWGLLHGLYLAAALYWRPLQKALARRLSFMRHPWMRAWRILFTFNLVSFAWIFFRARSLADASYIVCHLFAPSRGLAALTGLYERSGLLLALGATAAILVIEGISTAPGLPGRFFRLPAPLRWLCYYALLFATILFSMESGGAFIYMRF